MVKRQMCNWSVNSSIDRSIKITCCIVMGGLIWVGAFYMTRELSFDSAPFHTDGLSASLFESLPPDLVDKLSRVNASPDNPRLQLEFADALREAGSGKNEMEYLRGALYVYNKVLEQFPNSERAALALATISYEVELYDKAEQYFYKVYLNNSEAAHIRIKLGFAMLAQGKREDALKMFGDELRLRPDSALARLGEELSGRWVAAGMSGNASLDSRRDSVFGAIERLSETESPEVMQLILGSPVLKGMLAQADGIDGGP